MRRLCFWMLAVVSLVVLGCKSEPAKTGEKKEPPKSEAAAKEAPPPSEAAAPVAAPEAKAEVPKENAAGEPAKTPEQPAITPPVDPNAGKAAAEVPFGTPPPGAAPPPPEMNYQPQLDRLMDTFVELYCARQRGASDTELYELYKKLGYPPIAEWDLAFRVASMYPEWSQDAMNRVREKCAPAAPAVVPAMGGGTAPAATPPGTEAPAPADGKAPAVAPAPAGAAAPAGAVAPAAVAPAPAVVPAPAAAPGTGAAAAPAPVKTPAPAPAPAGTR